MNTELAPHHTKRSSVHRRPLCVTLLALGVLTLAGINLLRFVVSLQQWDFLDSLLSVPSLYIAVTGIVWAVAGLIMVWGLWSGKRWAVRGTQAMALLYSLYYWLDRLLVATGGGGYNLPFILGINIILVLLVFWILSNRKARAFFGAMND